MFISSRESVFRSCAAAYGLALLLCFACRSEAEDVTGPLRVSQSDSPTIELYQNTSTGFPEYEWDIFANEFGFRIADVDNFAVPFLIEPTSADDSFVMKSNGNIGLGTALANNIGSVAATGRMLNLRAVGSNATTGVANMVIQGNLGAQLHLVHNGHTANDRKILRIECKNGTAGFHVLKDNLAAYQASNALAINMNTGFIGMGISPPLHPLHLKAGAHCKNGTTWTNASSRELKQDIEPITSGQALEAVRALEPVSYRYKSDTDEKFVGFIAEDVPELVAMNDRKGLASMDVVAVLTKVVQDQAQIVQEQQVEMRDQKVLLQQQQKLLDEQRQALQAQQTLLNTLTQRLGEIERNTASATSK